MSCCSSVFFVFLLTAAVFSEAISGRLRHSETRVCRRLPTGGGAAGLHQKIDVGRIARSQQIGLQPCVVSTQHS